MAKNKPKIPASAAQRVGARLTAIRRFAAEKIRKKIREEGRSYIPEEPALMDASDLVIADSGGKHLHPNSKYREEYAKFAAEMCRLGATDVEVARGLGISLSCLWRWQATHETFFRAFLEGKDHCDDRVERALYQRAVGYSHPDLHISSYQGQPVVVPYIKHIPPDVGAASRWLKSRRKDQWGESQELTLKGDDVFADMWKAISTGQVLSILKSDEPVDENPDLHSGGGSEDEWGSSSEKGESD